MGKRGDITAGNLPGSIAGALNRLLGVDLDRQFSCAGKVKWAARLPATRAAYALSEARGYEFDIYKCRHCWAWHVGRRNTARRPE